MRGKKVKIINSHFSVCNYTLNNEQLYEVLYPMATYGDRFMWRKTLYVLPLNKSYLKNEFYKK